jgi:hypothetical protein
LSLIVGPWVFVMIQGGNFFKRKIKVWFLNFIVSKGHCNQVLFKLLDHLQRFRSIIVIKINERKIMRIIKYSYNPCN